MPHHNPTLGGGGFHHVAIRSRDFDAAVAFYTETLGFVEKIAWGDAPNRAVMLDTGDGNYLEIFERPGETGGSDDGVILHMAFRTHDVDAALERARAAGREVTMEPKDVDIPSRPHTTPVRIAFFKGPDGEVIELFQNELT
jgi:glyoxylase I family protein